MNLALSNSEVKPKTASGVVKITLPACRGFAANDPRVHRGCSGCSYDCSSEAIVYNHFRYYDPTTGRYVQSDRIGLGDGTNTYLYAAANPLMYIDPTGLVAEGNHKLDQAQVEKIKESLKDPGLDKKERNKLKQKLKRHEKATRERGSRHSKGGKQRGFVRPGFLGGLSTGIGLLLWPNDIACAELDCDGDGLVDFNGLPLNPDSSGCEQ